MSESARTKSGNMKLWIGALVVLLLIAFITWQGVREDVAVQESTLGTAALLRVPPESAAVGEAVVLRWEVRAPVGASTTHTAIHWGTVSVPGILGQDVASAQTAYPELISDYASGTFSLPREFSGGIVFPQPGTYYLRAHAVIDGQHYWSPEHTVEVE
ncbi:MAG: hypothetical protein Q7S96_04300 [bacterium]|nr:hypothetical protein [bacterium]